MSTLFVVGGNWVLFLSSRLCLPPSQMVGSFIEQGISAVVDAHELGSGLPKSLSHGSGNIESDSEAGERDSGKERNTNFQIKVQV